MAVSHDRLYWSCRRGMLELDLILIPFLQHQYDQLDQQQQQDFQQLLTATDVELFAWLTGREQPEQPAMQQLVTRIRTYAHSPNRDRQV